MFIRSRIKILLIVSSLFLFLSLAGCINSSTDEAKIMQIAKNIETAIEEKDMDLFMENISYNYSDPNGGTYDNHINGLPEEVISQIELVEELLNSIPGLKIVTDVSITELIITELYATGKMEIKFSLEACIAFICFPVPGIDAEESTNYNVDFQKEGEDWKIISLEEI